MNLLKRLPLLGLSSALILSACTGSDTENLDGNAELRAAVALDANSDVSGIRYNIVSCDGEYSHEEIRGLEDQLIPGNLGTLQDNPLDADSGHMFADLFKVVDAGCYNVSIQPIQESGRDSEICAGAHQNGVEVLEGQTTEIFLLSQCAGTDPGAIDIIAALNHEPTLEDVIFEDSKFVCGSPAPVCALGSDSDNDPLEYVFTAPEGCDVGEQYVGEQGYTCVDIACHDFGRFDLNVTVYDLVHKDGSLIRVEDWLAQAGYPNDSHATLNFFAYFDGVKTYPDSDNDGFGDAGATATLVCTQDDVPQGSTTDNSDCDDTNVDVHPGAEEVCGDGLDNDCSEGDETCPDPDPECDGQSCGNFDQCNDGGSCGDRGVCASISGGGGVCVDGSTACAALPDCSRGGDASCAEGSYCLVDTCCGRPVCVAEARVCSDAPEARAFYSDPVGLTLDGLGLE